MISTEDCLWYIDEALNGMVAIITELGDELANHKADVPCANSPYAILTHCLGVLEDWGGSYIAGRVVARDRDAEFRARGSVGELVARARRARMQFETDLGSLQGFSAVRGAIDPDEADLPFYRTQGGALIHVFEELAQHHGQMEVTRDVLRAPWARFADDRT